MEERFVNALELSKRPHCARKVFGVVKGPLPYDNRFGSALVEVDYVDVPTNLPSCAEKYGR